MLRCRLAFALVLVFAPSLGSAQGESRSPATVDIVANDYAFVGVPQRVAAGPTLFAFVNQGKVAHEMAFGRLQPGATIDDVLKVSKAGGRIRDIVTRLVGILVAGPGKSPDGRILVDLIPGETYLVFCNFRDTPDAPPHMTLGMYATFTAR